MTKKKKTIIIVTLAGVFVIIGLIVFGVWGIQHYMDKNTWATIRVTGAVQSDTADAFANLRAPSSVAVPPLNESVPVVGWSANFVLVNVSAWLPVGAHTRESEPMNVAGHGQFPVASIVNVPEPFT